MILKSFPVPPLGCNCSIIGDPVTKQAVVVDPGGAIEHILREDRSLLELVDSDYAFLNAKLAEHYGVPGVEGDDLRKVTLPPDSPRGGIITQGTVLAVTSNPTRTSPVKRGVFILDNILGTPPPPAPPNVPDLEEARKEFKGREPKLSEMLAAHRSNKLCHSCHSRMDPLGFALENFDAIGRWRTTSGTAKIDPSGVMPDGAKFAGPVELRSILTGRSEEVVSATTRKMMTYALGRGIEYYDMPSVRAIVHEAAPGDYKWSSIILGIIKSAPFQMRRAAQS